MSLSIKFRLACSAVIFHLAFICHNYVSSQSLVHPGKGQGPYLPRSDSQGYFHSKEPWRSAKGTTTKRSLKSFAKTKSCQRPFGPPRPQPLQKLSKPERKGDQLDISLASCDYESEGLPGFAMPCQRAPDHKFKQAANGKRQGRPALQQGFLESEFGPEDFPEYTENGFEEDPSPPDFRSEVRTDEASSRPQRARHQSRTDPQQGEHVYVDVPSFGQIFGTVESSLNGSFYFAFRGIPYSKAGRFQDFVAPEQWDDPLDCTEFGASCFTPDGLPSSSEACLFLNVYTSNIDAMGAHHDKDGDRGAPVLIFIHGGGFVWGNGNVDPVYFMDSRIVVVTFNYRLGPFGFLHSSDPDANIRGNYGLKDQIQVLRWVRQSISAFGGNPDDVTLMGLSAGAGSVHLLMLAKHETEGLFHKAISMSKTALSPSSIQKSPKTTFLRFAKAVGCSGSLTDEPNESTYQCIRAMDAVTLSTSWSSEFAVLAGQPFTFVPVVDGAIILDDPEALLRGGYFLRIPWLTGMVRDEGSMLLGDALVSPHQMAFLNASWSSNICPYVMEMGALDPNESTEICEAARLHYMGTNEIGYNTIYEFMKMAGDRLYNVALQRSAEYHSGFAPTYGYRYEYQSPTRGFLANYYEDVPMEVPRLSSLVPHADDFVQLFLGDHEPITAGDPDDFVHEFLIGSILNFIKTGTPLIPDHLGYDIAWPQFSSELPVLQVVGVHPRVDSFFAQPHDYGFWASVGL